MEHSQLATKRYSSHMHVLLQMGACPDHNKQLTVADRCLSRPRSIGLACSDWPSHQNVSPLTAVGGSEPNCCFSEYHFSKMRVWQNSTARNYTKRESFFINQLVTDWESALNNKQSNTLLLQTGATPDQCPLAWHVLIDPPTRMYPFWQL